MFDGTWMTNGFWSLVGLLLIFIALGGAFLAALPWIVGPFFRVVLWPRYGFRTRGLEHLPKTGPVVVIANHVSWLDGFLIPAISPRAGKVLVNARFVNLPVLRWIARRAGVIPIPSSGPRAHRVAIQAARETLDQGEALLIFPEATISRSGRLGSFYRGIEVIMHGREQIPIIPVFLDNVWGSVFSYEGGRFFWKWPKGWRRIICVAVGPPVEPPIDVFNIRQALLIAGVRASELGPDLKRTPPLIDLNLPHLDHPELGLLAASSPNIEKGDILLIGQKPGSVGQAAPGVALRVVEPEKHLQALLPGRADWVETGYVATLDKDGFVYIIA